MTELLDRYLAFLQDATVAEVDPDRARTVRLELARAFTRLTHQYLDLQCRFADLETRHDHLRQEILQDFGDVDADSVHPGSVVDGDRASIGTINSNRPEIVRNVASDASDAFSNASIDGPPRPL